MRVDKKLKVLFFPAWFPNKTNKIAGNFVLQHAKCLNDDVDLAVFYVYDDFALPTFFKCETYVIEGITVYRVSFKRYKSFFLFPVNILLYVLATFKGYLYQKNKFGKADINHVHVLTRTAVLPYFLKQVYKTPYVISEHWSRYLPQTNLYNGILRKWVTKLIVRSSNGIATVSEQLMTAMVGHGLKHENAVVISNTVDDKWFTPHNFTEHEGFKFLHVSSIQDGIKNITGILSVAAELKKNGLSFSLDIVGEDLEREGIERYAEKLLLNSFVKFHGKLFGLKLMEKYQNADAFVLFSNFETQSCVLLESFAIGLPVIATNVGGIPEIVNHRNGVLVEIKDEKALARTMTNFINGHYSFEREIIRLEANVSYGFRSISNKLLDFYQKALRN